MPNKPSSATIIDERYRAMAALGEGGFARVLKTEDLKTGKLVAVKVLRADFSRNKEIVQRFQNEADQMSRIQHPNLLSVSAQGFDAKLKRHYYVMELVEGLIDADIICAKFPLENKLEIIIQAANGLSFLHDAGLIHRDIKPDNIIVHFVDPKKIRKTSSQILTAASNLQAKVSDLGIAKDVHADASLTRSGAMMGTPYYMSPNQTTETKHVTPSDDIYSLGATLYHLVTGTPPYGDGGSIFEIMSKKINQEAPAAPRSLDPKIPVQLEKIVLKAMAFEEQDRYGTMDEFKDELKKYLATARRTDEASLHRSFYGARVKRRLALQQAAAETEAPKKKRSAKRLAILGAVLVILVAGLILFGKVDDWVARWPLADLTEKDREVELLFESISGDWEKDNQVDAAAMQELIDAIGKREKRYSRELERAREISKLAGEFKIFRRDYAKLSGRMKVFEKITVPAELAELTRENRRLRDRAIAFQARGVGTVADLAGILSGHDEALSIRKIRLHEYGLFAGDFDSACRGVEEYIKTGKADSAKLEAYALSLAEKQAKLGAFQEAGFDVSGQTSRLAKIFTSLKQDEAAAAVIEKKPEIKAAAPPSWEPEGELSAEVNTAVTRLKAIIKDADALLADYRTPDHKIAAVQARIVKLRVYLNDTIMDRTHAQKIRNRAGVCYQKLNFHKQTADLVHLVLRATRQAAENAERWKNQRPSQGSVKRELANLDHALKNCAKLKPHGFAAVEDARRRILQCQKVLRYLAANEIAQGFVLVEMGTFMMGSETGGTEDERPAHEVTVGNFCMSACEVTVGEFKAFVAATKYRTDAEKGSGAYVMVGGKWQQKKGAFWRDPYFRQKDTNPVVCVSWLDAVAYCNWLSGKDGLEPCYTITGEKVSCDFQKQGYRLPTEAEWEYAARGGKLSQGFIYSGSNTADEVAWHQGNAAYRTQAVGKKKANELGLYDMSGNALEWCWDWYEKGYYVKSPKDNPKGAAAGKHRVLRGGSWKLASTQLRTADRDLNAPNKGHDFYGFRIVKTIK